MKFQPGSCASWPVHRWFGKKAGIEVLGFVADRKLLRNLPVWQRSQEEWVMQVTLTVQRHMEGREWGLNMPSGGLRIPCWCRRCRVEGKGVFKKMPASSLVKKAVRCLELLGKDFIGMCPHLVEAAPTLM